MQFVPQRSTVPSSPLQPLGAGHRGKLLLDAIQPGEALQRLLGDLARPGLGQRVELAPRVRRAARLDAPVQLEHGVEPA